jgi:hypothetical protein
MRQEVERLIEPAVDQSRNYNLCGVCPNRIQATRDNVLTSDPVAIVVRGVGSRLYDVKRRRFTDILIIGNTAFKCCCQNKLQDWSEDYDCGYEVKNLALFSDIYRLNI